MLVVLILTHFVMQFTQRRETENWASSTFIPIDFQKREEEDPLLSVSF